MNRLDPPVDVPTGWGAVGRTLFQPGSRDAVPPTRDPNVHNQSSGHLLAAPQLQKVSINPVAQTSLVAHAHCFSAPSKETSMMFSHFQFDCCHFMVNPTCNIRMTPSVKGQCSMEQDLQITNKYCTPYASSNKETHVT